MNYEWAFLPMEVSNDLLGDPQQLRERLSRDGYLYFSRALDRDRIMEVRWDFLKTLRRCGWLEHVLLKQGRCGITPLREGDPEFFTAYDEIQKLESFHALAHDEQLLGIMRDVLGPSAFPHPLKIARLIFPDHFEISTPPHQDYPNNQGTPNLTATWIPLGDLPREMGGIAILRGSHQFGPLPVTTHFGAGNRCAVLPQEMLERCRWVTTQYEAGDVLVFPAMTVHAALHNASTFFMRLSIDFRYQLEGEALTPICLEPHFQRLSWDEIYRGWKRKDLQYYWKDLDFEVVPFREFELVPRMAVEDEVAEFGAYERRRDARFEHLRRRSEPARTDSSTV